MIAEYAKKCSTEEIAVLLSKDFSEIEFTIFPKNIGANDLYVAMSNYLIDYATFINVLSEKSMENVKYSNEDAKFYFIDVYTRIVANTFAVIDEEQTLSVAKDMSNLTTINAIYSNNKPFNLVENSFKKDALSFISYYINCDKAKFCANLNKNLNYVNSITATSSLEEKAAYYFSAVYGV